MSALITRLPVTSFSRAHGSLICNTVEVAYDDLRAEGYIKSRAGAGRFVADDLKLDTLSPRHDSAPSALPVLAAFGQRAQKIEMTEKDAVAIDFRYGHPDLDGDVARDWHRELVTVTAREPSLDAFTYGDPQGHIELRRAIAGYLNRARGVRADPSQIIVVNGSQQGLDLVARVMLEPGERAAIEDPHYLGARAVFQTLGATLLSRPVDGHGMVVPRSAARLAYVTPSHQFPTGVVMSMGRRVELLRWAETNNAYLIEDDYDSEFRFDGPPLQAIFGLGASDRTIYLGTFSKVLFPALRLGYLVVPPPLVDAMRGAKWLADRHSPTLEQRALAHYIESGRFERAVRRARTRNMNRRRALVDALAQVRPRLELTGTSAGLHLMATLPDTSLAALDALIGRARAAGLGLYSTARYHWTTAPRPSLLFGFSTLTEPTIRRGIDQLQSMLGR